MLEALAVLDDGLPQYPTPESVLVVGSCFSRNELVSLCEQALLG